MVETVRRLLMEDGTDGFPMLQVWENCENTIVEFQAWSYKRTAHGDLPPGPDKYEDRNNHAMDVVKGVIATNMLHKQQAIWNPVLADIVKELST